MTPPDTNLNKQKKRHRGPIVGITVVLLVVGGLFIWFLVNTMVVEPTDQPEEPAAETEADTVIPADEAEDLIIDPDDNDERATDDPAAPEPAEPPAAPN